MYSRTVINHNNCKEIVLVYNIMTTMAQTRVLKIGDIIFWPPGSENDCKKDNVVVFYKIQNKEMAFIIIHKCQNEEIFK